MSDLVKPKKDYNKTPQELISDFWAKFLTKKPGKVTNIFPRSLYENLLPPFKPQGASSAKNAAESYEAAAKDCRDRVKRIVKECYRTNEKFTDPDFDIESDKVSGLRNCLQGLVRDGDGLGAEGAKKMRKGEKPLASPRYTNTRNARGGVRASSPPRTSVDSYGLRSAMDTLVSSQVVGAGASVPMDLGMLKNFVGDSGTSWDGVSDFGAFFGPQSVHRVDWIFDSPQWTIDGYGSSDIKQGANGDCWWLAAVATLCNRKDLMDKVCVARDEECGVYGFVFYRDGEWVPCVVDDNLYLKSADFDYYGDTLDPSGKKAREHKKRNQTGSEALYFAQCSDQNEIWLPILEKAYAKAHGDYDAISGGWSGEAVEDMTGGVTTTLVSNRVLNKTRLWKELVNSDGNFVFAASAMGLGWDWKRNGLALGHAYSILRATEEVDEDGNKIRLVLIRNPWGERDDWSGVGEWSGPWSDGSKEWTPYWLKKLNHTFGDDGVFWMSYKDLLSNFMFLHRTRIFDEKWTVVQQWTRVNISWVTGYLNHKFVVEVKKAGPVVFVLSQLDERYFKGLEGQYTFALHFVLQEAPSSPGPNPATSAEHIVRVRPAMDWEKRSVSAEVDLEPGKYEVLPKILATRDKDDPMVEDVVRDWVEKNPQKMRQIGMNYDIAHAKGGLSEEEIKEAKEKKEKEKKEKEEKEKKEKEEKEAKEKAEKEEKEKKEKEEKEAKEKAEAEVKKADEEETKKVDADAAEKKDDEKKSDDDFEKVEKSSEGSKDEATPGVQKKVEAPGTVKSDETGENKDDTRDGEKDDDRKADDKKDDDKQDEKKDDKPADDLPPTPAPLDSADDISSPPWNAVCVVGLRVYAKDPDVSIKLIKPKDDEEAAVLDVDGEKAGATM